LGQVARVAQAVLLPQLAKQVLHAAHGPEVVGKVALEKGVDTSAQHKPHDGREVTVAERRPYPLDDGKGDPEDDSASSSKHADQLERVPFVGDEACNLGLDGVVRVVLPREEGEVAGGHGEGAMRRKDVLGGRDAAREGIKRGGERREQDETSMAQCCSRRGSVALGFPWTQQRNQDTPSPLCFSSVQGCAKGSPTRRGHCRRRRPTGARKHVTLVVLGTARCSLTDGLVFAVPIVARSLLLRFPFPNNMSTNNSGAKRRPSHRI
jgi:hypothetical protein